MTETIGIHFGALCDPIEKQLKEQGCIIPEKDSDRFQKMADCITRLHLNNIIPDSVRNRAREKLMKQISKSIHAKDAP